MGYRLVQDMIDSLPTGFYRCCIAEAVGTFCLVFFGCLSIVVEQQTGLLGHGGVAAAFGLVVMAMIYSVGNISGAHLNPAISLGFFFAGRLSLREALAYSVVQLVAAIAAGITLRLLFDEEPQLGATQPGGSVLMTFFLEALFTFVLMFVILNVSTGHMEKGIMAGVAVGGMVALLALVGGPLTGASMNPARSLGPGLVSVESNALWLYLVAPIIGAGVAHPFCRWTQGDECCIQEERGREGPD